MKLSRGRTPIHLTCDRSVSGGFGINLIKSPAFGEY